MQLNWSGYQQNPIHYGFIFDFKLIYLVVSPVIINNEKYLVLA